MNTDDDSLQVKMIYNFICLSRDVAKKRKIPWKTPEQTEINLTYTDMLKSKLKRTVKKQ